MLTIPKRFPKPGFYYHYKHDPTKGPRHFAYEVVGVGFHTEGDCRPQDACMVDYRPLYESAAVYQASLEMGLPVEDHRPVDMFMEDVNLNGKTVPRFQKIDDPDVIEYLNKIKKEMYE